MKKIFIPFAFLLVLFACSTDIDQELETTPVSIETKIIAQSNLYGGGAEGISKDRLIIKNESDWNELISKINSVNAETDNFSETNIDFNTHQIIAVFDDIKSTGGYSMEMIVTKSNQQIIAKVTSKGFEGAAITVITQPYLIVRIPQSDMPVVFQ
ncbi:hypothetical protein [Fulvivirga sp.]|uniref:hypothetical protein n=1 Tax=Fulvivirga sp. TaxID=1931237 RepID=UPI0032ECA983